MIQFGLKDAPLYLPGLRDLAKLVMGQDDTVPVIVLDLVEKAQALVRTGLELMSEFANWSV